jgi:hypothetical protein
MLIYKFRITLEENDNFLREIEIRPSQTFKDFHEAMLDCSALTLGELASFFICDIKWRKQQEITLVKAEDDENRARGDKPPVKIMSKTLLNNCIESPNEQLIYINDFQKMHTFYIELFKIYDNQEKITTFPRCVKRFSDVPKTITQITNPGTMSNDEEETQAEFEDELDDELMEDNDKLVSDEDNVMLDDIFEETNPNESN